MIRGVLILWLSLQSMEVVPGDREGVVVAAPHEGFDMNTEPIARAVAETLGAPAVIARDYRKKSKGRYHNVNRPTGEDEVEGEEHRAVFEQWVERVREACPAPVPLYIEIHGHSREGVDAAECATVGFDEKTLKRLKKIWNAHESLPPLFFDVTDPEYELDGRRVKFYFKAGGAKRTGILQETFVTRALHVELPPSIRRDEALRTEAAAAIAEMVEAVKPR